MGERGVSLATMVTDAHNQAMTEAERMQIASASARERHLRIEARIYCEQCSERLIIVGGELGHAETRARVQRSMREHADQCPGRDR